ncbi:BrnA antitoxin family protein [uncultured Enterovirga sp.]|uniref:BrnA antitoxin family protein n=1 Tax=uncultured Enterovirga sp. TaxID=2026352 RepID=UPI0035CA52DF
MNDRHRRGGTDPWARAEAAFKAATDKPAEPSPAKAAAAAIPGAKEQVTLRIDRDVLDFFQAEGAGWQDRINAALRLAAGQKA